MNAPKVRFAPTLVDRPEDYGDSTAAVLPFDSLEEAEIARGMLLEYAALKLAHKRLWDVLDRTLGHVDARDAHIADLISANEQATDWIRRLGGLDDAGDRALDRIAAASRTPFAQPAPGLFGGRSLSQLLSWVVKHATARDRPRWGVVADRFGLGSTEARRMCDLFGHDPDYQRVAQSWPCPRDGCMMPRSALTSGAGGGCMDEDCPAAPWPDGDGTQLGPVSEDTDEDGLPYADAKPGLYLPENPGRWVGLDRYARLEAAECENRYFRGWAGTVLGMTKAELSKHSFEQVLGLVAERVPVERRSIRKDDPSEREDPDPPCAGDTSLEAHRWTCYDCYVDRAALEPQVNTSDVEGITEPPHAYAWHLDQAGIRAERYTMAGAPADASLLRSVRGFLGIVRHACTKGDAYMALGAISIAALALEAKLGPPSEDE